MTTQKDAKQALEQTPEQGNLMTLINQSAGELSKVLPQHMNPERMARS